MDVVLWVFRFCRLVWTSSDRLQFWLHRRTSDFKAELIPLEWILIQPNKPKMLFFQQRRRTFRRNGVGLMKFFVCLFFFWRGYLLETFGNPIRFPSKENSFLETGTKTMKYQKNSDWRSVCSFTSRFLFFFLQQRCQRRARPKQTDWMHKEQRAEHFTSQNEQNKNYVL